MKRHEPVKQETGQYAQELLQARCSSGYNRVVKRMLDVVLAMIGMIVMLPFFIVIALLIAAETGLPVMYRAERGGYRGKTFKICKFRTMVKDADKIGGGTTALNDSRVTRVGRILRKTKLDEIPQLLNILKGDMSFVGPRPELLQYTSQYQGIYKKILDVRPGITDYASVTYISLDEVVGSQNADEYYEKYVLAQKNLLRVKYVAEISLWCDVKLFFMTVYLVLEKIWNVVFTGKKRMQTE